MIASVSIVLVFAGLRTGDAKNACVCEDRWSYPEDYYGGMCVGPIIGCPSAPCDDDSKGPWCVVTNRTCNGAEEYSEGGHTYYYAYCSPASPRGPEMAPDGWGIRYIGRFDMTNQKAPRFAWSMTGISTVFQGSRAVYGTFSFSKDGGRLRVVVDGETVGFVQQAGRGLPRQFLLAHNLDSSKSHILEVYKVSEWGEMTFGGFQLDSGSFAHAPKVPARRMEFIGDSDTAGWCADGSPKSHGGGGFDAFEDAYVTWAQQLARSLGAEPMVEAISGWGVTSSSTPIQSVLNYAVRVEPKVGWNYSQWSPDAVVILIGPNDEQTNGKGFIKQYKRLLDMVAANYKNAKPPPKIIHVCGGSLNGFDPCNDIQTANEQFNTEQDQRGGGVKGFYTSITKDHWNLINGPNGKGTSVYNGCEGHYNEKGHSVLAQDILPQIQRIMAWDVMVV